ncbi:hypothetical protein C0J52_06595 [Blattella germanica]|nr:hypothetical protein C0J52_06595 [Blattella germanica]PSN49435.1 hypothetical protein C0J52_06595 [Blattella germanica]PSN49436.1 hypothetical protein C0J52_06595 [Blattella germanica]PSN49437.1 hypothetical protein C0J52_06595 [Blattella germanica]
MLDILNEEELHCLAAGTLLTSIFIICYIINFASSRLRLSFPIRTGCLCFGAGALFQVSILHLLINAHNRLPHASFLFYCLGFIFMSLVDQIFRFYHRSQGYLCNIVKCKDEPSFITDYDHCSFDSSSSFSRRSSDDDDTFHIGRDRLLDRLNKRSMKQPLTDTVTNKYGSTGATEIQTYSGNVGLFDPKPSTSRAIETSTSPNHEGCVECNYKLNTSRSTPSFTVSPPREKRRKISEYTRPPIYEEPRTSGLASILIHPNNLLDPAFRKKTSFQHEYNEVPGNDVACNYDHQVLDEIANQPGAGLTAVLLPICIHSVLGGISIGLEKMDGKMQSLCHPIDCSRLMLAACLAMELKNIDAGKYSFFFHVLFYSITSAMGNIIGLMIRKYEQPMDSHIVPTMQAVAAGMLLFAVCLILNREKVKLQLKQAKFSIALFQVCSFGIGFFIMHLIDIFIVPGLPDPPDFTVNES